MTTAVTDRLGLSVLYTLTEVDVRMIVQRRRDAGSAIRSGNEPREGDTYPAIIVRDHAGDPAEHARVRALIAAGKYADKRGGGYDELIREQLAIHDALPSAPSVNLQVWLDGNDAYWATSRSEFDPRKHGNWYEKADEVNALVANGASYEQMEAAGHTFRADPKGHWRRMRD